MTTKRKKAAPEWLRCNGCHNRTLHDLLKQVSETETDEAEITTGTGAVDTYPIWWTTTYQMFQCRGCKSVVLRRIYEFSEREEQEVRYFPPPVARLKPKWFDEIPHDVQQLMSEIYKCLDTNTRALPLMGARAVLDRIIVDTVGDVGTFDQKLKRLEEERHIAPKGREILEAALDAGSAAAHRGYAPREKQVQSVMDIVENLVHSTYVLGRVAEEIKKATPPRPERKKKAQT